VYKKGDKVKVLGGPDPAMIGKTGEISDLSVRDLIGVRVPTIETAKYTFHVTSAQLELVGGK
jgi:ribosomal protein L24